MHSNLRFWGLKIYAQNQFHKPRTLKTPNPSPVCHGISSARKKRVHDREFPSRRRRESLFREGSVANSSDPAEERCFRLLSGLLFELNASDDGRGFQKICTA